MSRYNPRVTIILQQAKGVWGNQGWKQLSPQMREAYICREIVFSLLGQATISGGVMKSMIEDARTALQTVEGGE